VSLEVPDDRSLRCTFDRVASEYAAARPPLPPDLVDAWCALAGVPAGGRVLEVGCGPGEFAATLAARGLDVTCVELGARLADVARARLAPFPNASVVHADFDEWPLPAEPFDVVTALHAWHWLDAERAIDKAAQALRPGGALAIIGGGHVGGGDTDFFNAAQRCYEAHMPGTVPGQRMRAPETIEPTTWGLERSPHFEPPVLRRWVEVHEYTTETYFQLISSFSGHIALDDDHRARLYTCLRELLERDYGGRVRRATMTELCVVRRR
jgi:SAM-dependent methyltransferase